MLEKNAHWLRRGFIHVLFWRYGASAKQQCSRCKTNLDEAVWLSICTSVYLRVARVQAPIELMILDIVSKSRDDSSVILLNPVVLFVDGRQ